MWGFQRLMRDHSSIFMKDSWASLLYGKVCVNIHKVGIVIWRVGVEGNTGKPMLLSNDRRRRLSFRTMDSSVCFGALL